MNVEEYNMLWETSYRESLKYINKELSREYEACENEYRELVHFIMGISENSYAWCGRSLCMAESMQSLIAAIHHAMVDDGDISFFICPRYSQCPFILLDSKDTHEAVRRHNRYLCADTEEVISRYERLTDIFVRRGRAIDPPKDRYKEVSMQEWIDYWPIHREYIEKVHSKLHTRQKSV